MTPWLTRAVSSLPHPDQSKEKPLRSKELRPASLSKSSISSYEAIFVAGVPTEPFFAFRENLKKQVCVEKLASRSTFSRMGNGKLEREADFC